MLKYIFSLIVLLHGLIHFMGFAKAFNYGNITQLTKHISKPAGVAWMITAFLFVAAVILLLLKKDSWAFIALLAAVLSQVLIVAAWQDAKFGTIVNIIVLLVAVAELTTQLFEVQFIKDVKTHFGQTKTIAQDLLTEADIINLPQPVQKYLKYCAVLNKPKVKNVRLVFDGQMRAKGKDWFKFQSVQYNFFDDPARLFFMKAHMFGIMVPGYHAYENAAASMQVKIFGLIPVAKARGNEMNKAETVTLFNDMCLMIPATLIDTRIEWQPIDSLSAKASFSNGKNKISATLYFNEQGALVNFISDDRYAINEMKQYRFSTPVKNYILLNGVNIPSYGETVWDYPDGKFVYGKFYLRSMAYNLTGFEK